MKRSTIVWGLAAMFAWSGMAWSQSLADLARKEEERRKAVKAPGKTYTNDDLRRYPVTTADTSTAAADPKAPAAADKAAADKAADGEKTADGKAAPSIDLGEEYWRKLINDARSTRARSSTYQEALESRIRSITSEFYTQTDPAQRAAMWAQRTKLIDDLQRLKQDIDDQDKAIAKIEEDGRKANIPPGWIR
jgi:hypothetical protein